MTAALDGVAAVVGAGVVVVAAQGKAWRAQALAALVSKGARVPVITHQGDRRLLAARPRQAAVEGAPVVVVAVRRGAPDTRAIRAAVFQGARISVVAVRLVVLVTAALDGVAAVVRAGVVVVAVEG
jgi:hypothetical protein